MTDICIYIRTYVIDREGRTVFDIYVGLALLRSQFAWRLFLLSGHLAFYLFISQIFL